MESDSTDVSLHVLSVYGTKGVLVTEQGENSIRGSAGTLRVF